MHFALPPRKTSHPPPYVRNGFPSAAQRRRRLIQFAAYTVLGLLTLYLVAKFIISYNPAVDIEDGPGAVEGPQDVVLVTMFDNATMSEDYMRIVRANRDDYAARHGREDMRF